MEIKEFYKKETQKLEHDRREVIYKYLELGLEFYKRELDFNYHFVVYLGLIAGFGFTAINKVQSNLLFIIAELILLLTAAYVLFFTKKVTASERSNLLGATQKSRIEFYRQWDELLHIAQKEKYPESAYKRHLAALVTPIFDPKAGSDNEIIVSPSYAIYSAFVGAALLLASFFWPSVSIALSCVKI